MRQMKIERILKHPVLASIILIAFVVAVSIAVAAWMGAFTFTTTPDTDFRLDIPERYNATHVTYCIEEQIFRSNPFKAESLTLVELPFRIKGKAYKDSVLLLKVTYYRLNPESYLYEKVGTDSFMFLMEDYIYIP